MDVLAFYGAGANLLSKRKPPLRPIRILRRYGLLKSEPELIPDVFGMASNKKLELLQLAVSMLTRNSGECYFEIGTFQGKSLIAAMSGNPAATGIACDNFSLFDDPNHPQNSTKLKNNIDRHELSNRVQIFNCDFRDLIKSWQTRSLPPVGVYFYDGAHDEESQFLGIRLAENILADEALVIVDDWRLADDSESYAENGTRRAIAESTDRWSIDHVLPARYNGDRDLWWNGLALLRYQRVHRVSPRHSQSR